MSIPVITPEVVTTCRNGVGEGAEAWQRAFGAATELTVGETSEFLAVVAQDTWNCAGFAVVLEQASGAYVLLVADREAKLPSWIPAPDATGKSKLATLAQEYGMILLPEAAMPTADRTGPLDNVQEALLRIQTPDIGEALALSFKFGDATLPALLVGIADAEKLFAPAAKPAAPPEPAAAAPVSAPAAAAAAAAPPIAEPPLPPSRFANVMRQQVPTPRDFEDGIPQLPSYTRSLLKIKVPVVASLATTKLPVGRIVEIGPGSIIQFNQSCEQPLSLAVGDHEFAVGEAVKVGEKFGLRITSMVMPDERFLSVRGKRG
jgi:flagellar motor switch/type III secretory pathway protein FliN